MNNPVIMYYVYDKKVRELEDRGHEPEALLEYRVLREEAKFYSLKLIKDERKSRIKGHG